MLEKVIRVNKNEFELDNGKILPIIPPLEEDMPPKEFQEHYERAINIIQSIKDTWSHNEDSEELG
jgi:hypothetical protein